MTKIRGFTLIELLVVIAIIAILAAILFPVFAQARGSARQISCLSNVKQCTLASMMYAQDFDETFPRFDNNGSAYYGENVYHPGTAVDTPDWGNLTFAAGGEPASHVMYFAVIQPYMKNRQIMICPEFGKTNWAGAIADAGNSGIVYPGAYNPNLENFYYDNLGQMAVSIYVIDWNAYWPGASNALRSMSHISAISRPGETILMTGESTWDWNNSISLGVGNEGVWPSAANSQCADSGAEGWTFYLHRGGRGKYPSAAPDRDLNNPNMKGFANFGFCDGHAKALKHSQAESCVFSTDHQEWYYPYWETRY